MQASASTEHARRSLELEKADLLQTYRVVLQEKRRLEEDMLSVRWIDALWVHVVLYNAYI